jgi:aerobic-type carbon monoxide dehydrogenase small subunit (CoxS/CutS family)
VADEGQGFTRREFLRGAGIGAAGAVIAGSGLAGVARAGEGEGAGGAAPAVLGPGRVPVVLRVNGAEKKLALEPRATLAEALRMDLDLTGTKVVCDRGSCSACTVWLDGVPVCACMTLAIDVGPRAVTTIEGLAGDALHPVQACFIEHDAMQCGFCTPGMVMSCAALLARNPAPTIDDVRAAVSGNLCRCGTYPKVFEATLAAARRAAGGEGGSHGR